ncbi:MAG TPA: 50S ribosomal protein L7/L12 [Candidatus Azoamicus sp.]
MKITNEEILNAIENMNILELTELTTLIEKKFNISLQHQQITSNTENTEEKAKPTEKSTFTIIMTSFGDNKLNVIKTIRSILDLGLKEAKDFVEKLPATIKENVQKSDIEKIKAALETSGAKIEIR